MPRRSLHSSIDQAPVIQFAVCHYPHPSVIEVLHAKKVRAPIRPCIHLFNKDCHTYELLLDRRSSSTHRAYQLDTSSQAVSRTLVPRKPRPLTHAHTRQVQARQYHQRCTASDAESCVVSLHVLSNTRAHRQSKRQTHATVLRVLTQPTQHTNTPFTPTTPPAVHAHATKTPIASRPPNRMCR